MRLFQVGAGSGGMVVLDLLMRESCVTHVTLIDPDIYKAHNGIRHYFPPSAIGRTKVELAAEWCGERRADFIVEPLAIDLLDPNHQPELEAAVQACDVGICAVDSEPAKYHFDLLMRRAAKPWTMGEVLSGGIGGWVHRFIPEQACYGCVASHLQRSIVTDNSPPPDYSNPDGMVAETTIPASKASIDAIASLHALLTLDMLEGTAHDFTSLLWTLKRVPGMFDEAFRPYRFRIVRRPDCLICRPPTVNPVQEDLDVALNQALSRLADQ